jgi:GTP-binding protein
VSYGDGATFILADIPGLIEGAHEGAGLGIQFLRHIERTKILIHLLDLSPMTQRNPIEDYEAMNRELKSYNEELSKTPQIVALNKIDITEAREELETIEKHFSELGIKTFPISSATGEGTKELVWEVAKQVEKLRNAELSE